MSYKALVAAWLIAVACTVESRPLDQEGGAAPMRNEHQDGFAVVGVSVRTINSREAGSEGEIPKLWSRVMQQGLLDRIPNRADQNIVVVNSGYASDEKGEYDYTIGVRVQKAANVPDGFVTKLISPGQYSVIRSELGSPSVVVPGVWRHIWKMSPQELGGRRAFRTDFEVYPPTSDPQKVQIEVHIGLGPE